MQDLLSKPVSCLELSRLFTSSILQCGTDLPYLSYSKPPTLLLNAPSTHTLKSTSSYTEQSKVREWVLPLQPLEKQTDRQLNHHFQVQVSHGDISYEQINKTPYMNWRQSSSIKFTLHLHDYSYKERTQQKIYSKISFEICP